MRHQITYSLRDLRRSLAFAATVVLTLGLGIGATATLFVLLDRLLLSPPEHVAAPEEVHRVHVHGRSWFTKEVEYSAALTHPDYRDLEAVRSFDGIAAYTAMELTADLGGRPERLRAELASARYFSLLDVRPHAGRFYTEEEDRIEAEDAVAVLGHGFWRRAFGGDPDAIGSELHLGRGSYRIIGIAPAGFTGVDLAPVDVWLPVMKAGAIQYGTGWRDARGWWWLAAVARLDPEGRAAAEAEATARYVAGRAEARGSDPDARIVLSPLIAAKGPLASRESKVARALGGLALLVLLIACANVTNLILARGVRRRRVLAIQTALGVTRPRLVAQLLGESLVLAAAAGAVALLFTRLATPPLFRVLLPDSTMGAAGSLRLFAFTAGVSLAVTLLIGLVPALRTTRFDTLEALRTTRESRRSSAARRALLFAQAALSAVLVIGAGMFLRSLERARSLDMGLDTGAVAVQFELADGSRWGAKADAASYEAVERLRALPFVESAAVTQLPPFQGFQGMTVLVRGDTVRSGGLPPRFYTATGGYFEATGRDITRGRPLHDADDREGAAPVAVVSESLARAAFGDRDPLGECLEVEPDGETAPCTRVVGVVEDALPSIRAERPNLDIYLPPRHPAVEGAGAGVVMVRTRGPAAPRLDEIREVAASASPDIRIAQANTLRDFLEPQLRPWRLGAVLLTAFGILALVVAAGGLYSVLTFDVAQRRYELGVRAALGATAARIVSAVTLRAVVVCGLGVATGGVVAMMLSRLADALLFRVSPFEASVYAGGVALLALVVLAAAALPAWRAARVDPREALAGE